MTLSADTRAEVWLRRSLDRFGIHLQGSRGDCGFKPGVGIHAIALVCKGDVAHEDLSQIEAECITESGETVRLNHRMVQHGRGDRVLFVFYYPDSDIANLHEWELANSKVTNFCPTKISFYRVPDHGRANPTNDVANLEKLGTLELSH